MVHPLLSVKGVSKDFDGNVVLRDVNFELEKGKILGLIGENGAGKSTLMNILFGMSFIKETGGYKGSIVFDGEEINFSDPQDALKAGIGMVHQEFSLIPGFTACENINLNIEPTIGNFIGRLFGKRLNTLNRPLMREKAETALDTVGMNIDVDVKVSELPVGHKQFIEIAREINRSQVKLIIMDEPTAVLTESEADILITAMRELTQKGISMIFISHRLREIINVCDEYVVLRDGIMVKKGKAADATRKQLADLMVGRETGRKAEDADERVLDEEDIIMDIENLWVDMPGETVQDVTLKIKKGEIFGIGGLAGQGKLGIPNGLAGLYPSGGTVIFKGEKLDITNPKEILNKGIAFVSEDRRGVGLLLDEGIDWNIAFNAMQVQNRFLKKRIFEFRDEKAMRKEAEQYIESLAIKCTGPTQKARNLSGGNQQKVCLAKAFAMHPEFLFVSEPTRGIDVGAKQLVLEALKKYNRENGTTIVVISSELEELRSLSDRIAIICGGKVTGILPVDAPPAYFGLLMAGEDFDDLEEAADAAEIVKAEKAAGAAEEKAKDAAKAASDAADAAKRDASPENREALRKADEKAKEAADQAKVADQAVDKAKTKVKDKADKAAADAAEEAETAAEAAQAAADKVAEAAADKAQTTNTETKKEQARGAR